MVCRALFKYSPDLRVAVSGTGTSDDLIEELGEGDVLYGYLRTSLGCEAVCCRGAGKGGRGGRWACGHLSLQFQVIVSIWTLTCCASRAVLQPAPTMPP